MADTGLPPQSPWLDYDAQAKFELVQAASEVKSTLPNHIQTQVKWIMQESREKKEKELKIQEVFQALENKYPDFDRSKFKIEISGLSQEDLDYLWYEVFLLYSKDWKLLSYIKDNWETILDMTTFEPYWDNTLAKNIDKYMWFFIWIWEDWKWYVKFWKWRWHETEAWKKSKNKEEALYIEWSKDFDSYIFSKYVLKELAQENNESLRKVEVELNKKEIEAVWWKVNAIFEWNILVRYEIWYEYIIDVSKIDINNEFGNLLTKKVKWSYFERLKNWEIVIHMRNWETINQKENKFHKLFFMDFYRLKEPIF